MKIQRKKRQNITPRTPSFQEEEEESMVEEVQKISRFNNLLFHNLSYNL